MGVKLTLINKMARKQFGIVINGMPQSGKSVMLKYWIDAYSDTGRRIYIINPKREIQWDTWGIKRLHESRVKLLPAGGFQIQPSYDKGSDEAFRQIVSDIDRAGRKFSGLLVTDDATVCMGPENNKYLKGFYCTHGQKDMDYICVYHTLNAVPGWFADNSPMGILFQSGAIERASKSKVPAHWLVVQNVVNQNSDKIPYLYAVVDWFKPEKTYYGRLKMSGGNPVGEEIFSL